MNEKIDKNSRNVSKYRLLNSKNYINISTHLHLSFTFIHSIFIIEIFIYEMLDL